MADVGGSQKGCKSVEIFLMNPSVQLSNTTHGRERD